MKISWGIDPDTKNTGIAAVTLHEKEPMLLGAWVVANRSSAAGWEAIKIQSDKASEVIQSILLNFFGCMNIVTIETQRAYGKTDRTDPNALIKLAMVSGIYLNCFPSEVTYLAEPREWKKQVPKQIHQARSCRVLKLTYEAVGDQNGYVIPAIDSQHCFCNIKHKTGWKHAMDAVGLALWGLKEQMK